MKIRAFAAVFAAAAALAACGGGGDGPAPISVPDGVRSGTASSSSDITTANYSGFSGPVARATLHGVDAGVPAVAGSRESPMALAGLARQGLRVASSLHERALAVTSSTVACTYGGSMTVTFNDADNSQKLSRGDVLTLALSNCIAEFGDAPASGTMTMTFNAVELNAADEPTAMDVSISVTGFAEAGFGSMSGSMRIWLKDESATSTRARISYQGISVTEAGGATLVYDFDIYGVFGPTSGSFDIHGAIRVGGQTYVIDSDIFSYSGGSPPSSGAIQLRDAAGDRLVLRARSSTTVDLEFYPAGASVPSAAVLGVSWSSLR